MCIINRVAKDATEPTAAGVELVHSTQTMPLLTEVAAPLAIGKSFSGNFYKYAAPSGAREIVASVQTGQK